jgi:Resolvase, N terminal domain
MSGRRDDRPELAKVLALPDIDVLVIPKLDRLGRSTRHLLEIVELLEKVGAREPPRQPRHTSPQQDGSCSVCSRR